MPRQYHQFGVCVTQDIEQSDLLLTIEWRKARIVLNDSACVGYDIGHFDGLHPSRGIGEPLPGEAFARGAISGLKVRQPFHAIPDDTAKALLKIRKANLLILDAVMKPSHGNSRFSVTIERRFESNGRRETRNFRQMTRVGFSGVLAFLVAMDVEGE